MEEKKTTAKKPQTKKTKKPVKVELKDRLLEMAEFVDKSVKEERGKQLNTTSCARLNKIKMELLNIVRTLK